MSIFLFLTKTFLELSNFLILKVQLCHKAPFHATTVDISLIIELWSSDFKKLAVFNSSKTETKWNYVE